MQLSKEKEIIPIDAIRQDFPVLKEKVHGKNLIYFDNAATTQKPKAVIEALNAYYYHDNSNIHRGAHTLADRATKAYEASRDNLAKWFNAESSDQIIFTRGTTDGINLVAATFGRQFITEGDEIVLSTMEHHSNIVPWQMLCESVGAKIKVLPINEKGEIDLEESAKIFTDKTKLLAVVHVSNALGTINPISELTKMAREKGARVLIDGAQSASHLDVDVQKLDCDFFVCSAHKMYGPTGLGILYGKRDILEKMKPYQGGGEMIKEVDFEGTTYNELPFKFEAGTPNIADVIAFNASLKYLQGIGRNQIREYENDLKEYARQRLSEIDNLKFIGDADQKTAIFSFLLGNAHAFDVGMMLDAKGIAVRTGHHCSQPLMKHYGIEGTVRASLTFYNTTDEIDILVESLFDIDKKLN